MKQLVVTYDTDRFGNDIDQKRNSSLGECLTACADNPNCLAFTYNPTTRTCWLKNPVPNQKSSPGAISGVKQL